MWIHTIFYHSLRNNQFNNMSPPIVKCITKDEREKDGYSSFRQWIEDPKNVYIGNNLHKYAQDCTPSNWINPFQWINPFHMHYKGEDANKIYESFMRSNGVLLEYLPMLEDKVLGCWCKTGCHGEVIIKLYNEYVTYNEDSKLKNDNVFLL